MAGLNVAAIHEACAAQLRANIARPVTVYAFDPGPSRAYPCIVVDPGDPYVEYHETFGDNALAGIELRINVYIVAAGEIDQRIALADFASAGPTAASSILHAIETDPTFGGVVRSATMYRAHAPEVAPDDLNALVCTFDVSAYEHRES